MFREISVDDVANGTWNPHEKKQGNGEKQDQCSSNFAHTDPFKGCIRSITLFRVTTNDDIAKISQRFFVGRVGLHL